MTFATIDERSDRLARALRRIGLVPGNKIAIVCCDLHSEDARAAVYAATKNQSRYVEIQTDADLDELCAVFEQEPIRFILACAEGADLWNKHSLPGVLIADAPGGYWWRALELREINQAPP